MDGAAQSYAGDLDTHIILLITAKTAILSLSINKKNVTFMEYEKKYKEALDRAKKEWSSNLDNAYKNYRERLEIIFPELNESEDEKIRKELMDFIYVTCFPVKDLKKKERFLDWLEKQKERKSIWTESDRTMAFTLLRDVDQMAHISDEGKNERLQWLNSLEDKFNNGE